MTSVSQVGRQDWTTLLFSFNGRTTRSDYWLRFLLPASILGFIFTAIDIALGTVSPGQDIGLLSGLFYLALLWPTLAVPVKRCHDRDRSGWFLLIGLIPIIGLWLLVELGFLRGTIGDNRFGPDPLQL